MTFNVDMYSLLKELFPHNRSITGNGVRETLARMSKEIPIEETSTKLVCALPILRLRDCGQIMQKLNNYLAGNPRMVAEKALNEALQKLQNGLKNLAIYVAIKPMSITSKPRITKPNNI